MQTKVLRSNSIRSGRGVVMISHLKEVPKADALPKSLQMLISKRKNLIGKQRLRGPIGRLNKHSLAQVMLWEVLASRHGWGADRRLKSSRIGFLLGAPSSSRIAAFTNSVFFVGSVPYAVWTCPKQCSLGLTRMTARRKAGHPWPPSRMPCGAPCEIRMSVSWGMVE